MHGCKFVKIKKFHYNFWPTYNYMYNNKLDMKNYRPPQNLQNVVSYAQVFFFLF